MLNEVFSPERSEWGSISTLCTAIFNEMFRSVYPERSEWARHDKEMQRGFVDEALMSCSRYTVRRTRPPAA
jgi:hypothetical protein